MVFFSELLNVLPNIIRNFRPLHMCVLCAWVCIVENGRNPRVLSVDSRSKCFDYSYNIQHTEPHNCSFNVLRLTREPSRTGKGSFRSRSMPVLPFSMVGARLSGARRLRSSTLPRQLLRSVERVSVNERDRRNEDRERKRHRGHEIHLKQRSL